MDTHKLQTVTSVPTNPENPENMLEHMAVVVMIFSTTRRARPLACPTRRYARVSGRVTSSLLYQQRPLMQDVCRYDKSEVLFIDAHAATAALT